jgi:hypothetical protein
VAEEVGDFVRRAHTEKAEGGLEVVKVSYQFYSVWLCVCDCFVDEGVAKGSGANRRAKNSESICDFVWEASAILIFW